MINHIGFDQTLAFRVAKCLPNHFQDYLIMNFLRVNNFISLIKETYSDVNSEKEALLKIINLTENAMKYVSKDAEIILPDDYELESICNFGFLKKIIDPRTQIKKWFCLKKMGLKGTGKPILLADAKNVD